MCDLHQQRGKYEDENENRGNITSQERVTLARGTGALTSKRLFRVITLESAATVEPSLAAAGSVLSGSVSLYAFVMSRVKSP